jgi:hypothetical protein
VIDNRRDRFFTVAALGDNLDIRLTGEQAGQPLASQRFVVYDEGPDFLHSVKSPQGPFGPGVHARALLAPILPISV